MAARPVLALAMAPVLTQELLREEHRKRLREACELPDEVPLARFDEPRARRLLGAAEILLTGWGCPPLEAAVLERAPRLRAVVHAAGTVKNHVTEACWERGLRVSSAAAANAVPVAEYTVAAVLFANKRVFQLQRRYRELRAFRLWAREAPGLGNYRKTVGVVGASHIGRRVLEHLRRFDLRLLLADPYASAEEAAALGAELVPLDALVEESHVVSLHAPSLPETRHLMDARRLARMPDGATLVNTARGALVDGEALEAELASGRLFAVLDVTEPEVLPADSPLYELPNVFLTPHIAGALGSETERMGELAVSEVERLAAGRPLEHELRRADLERVA